MASDRVRITYDIGPRELAPAPGDYLVSIGRRGVGSVYQIVGARLVTHGPGAAIRRRFVLSCLRAPDMRERAKLVGDHVVLPGVTAWPLYWYPRGVRGRRRPIGFAR